jgi:hypothetical protein
MASQTLTKQSGTCSENENVEPLDQLIDGLLEPITSSEIAGAYCAICGQLLAQTIVSIRRRKIQRKDEYREKKRARRWLAERNIGVITFDEVCLTLGIDGDRTHDAIIKYAEDPTNNPISRAVIGVLSNADQ